MQRREGAIRIFAKGKVNRKDLYGHDILMALAKFLSPEMF
ncbi:DUF84 family protein [Candidatus Bathyarchaeota archaeon]|nr:DUF84 family protein [Candidatus Bathyarchaeota archaeon]